MPTTLPYESKTGPPLEPGEPVWLFGAGLVGRQTAALMASLSRPARGFLDNDARLAGRTVAGLPVLRPTDADLRSGHVVVCAGSRHEAIAEQLAGLGVERPLGLSELMVLLGRPVEPERGYDEDLMANRFRYLGLFARLEDAGSRRTLTGVLRHRLTYLPEPLRAVCAGDQWFIPEVFRPDPAAVFVDGGAFDGDSAADFVQRNGGPGEALELFEPDDALCDLAKRRFRGVRQARVHRAGLSDVAGTATFAATGGMDGALAGDGHPVRVVRLDEAVDAAVTYLKLDVEGAEEAALRGARRSIEASRPILAVAAYHHASDLWRIPAWIDGLDAGYRLYVRHHTELAFETVVYAVAAGR